MALNKYRENLRNILTHPSVTAHNPTILLVTPPPVHETHLQEQDLLKGYDTVTRHQDVTAEYANVVRELAGDFKDKKVVLVDLWNALMEEAARLTPSFVNDGKL